jgi:hypothetical protein
MLKGCISCPVPFPEVNFSIIELFLIANQSQLDEFFADASQPVSSTPTYLKRGEPEL